MSKVRLYGDTSGFVDLKAPDVASNVTITLPNTTGPFATETYVDAAVAAIPEIAGIGSNVVQSTKVNSFDTASASFVDVPDLSVTITPSSASSKILIMLALSASNGTYSSDKIQIRRGATNLLTSTSGSSSNATWSGLIRRIHDWIDTPILFTMNYLDSPSTTSAVTYHTSVSCTAGAFRVNLSSDGVNGATSSITAIEVAA